MRFPTEKRAEQRLHELLVLLARYREMRRTAETDGDAEMVQRAEDAIRMQRVLIRSHCLENDLARPPDVPERDGEEMPPQIQALARECARDALAGPCRAKPAREVDARYLEELARVLGRPATEVEQFAFRIAFEHALRSADEAVGAMDARKRRREEARLERLQADLNRFRGNFHVAIGSGDPAWVRRCLKAIRLQEEKIRRLREVLQPERPVVQEEASA